MAKGSKGRFQPAKKVLGKGKTLTSSKTGSKLASAKRGASPLGSKTSAGKTQFGVGKGTTTTSRTKSPSKVKANANSRPGRVSLVMKKGEATGNGGGRVGGAKNRQASKGRRKK